IRGRGTDRWDELRRCAVQQPRTATVLGRRPALRDRRRAARGFRCVAPHPAATRLALRRRRATGGPQLWTRVRVRVLGSAPGTVRNSINVSRDRASYELLPYYIDRDGDILVEVVVR